MGVFDFIKKQFIDVIEWNESGNGVLAYRFPMQDREIQNGGKLTVRESQLALFINEGEIADLFTPGMHTLTTRTLPLLTNLKHWDHGFSSPFKSDVYFFSTREQIDQKWGTPQPITVRDKEFGALRLRANGTFSFKIKNPSIFYKKLSGTREIYTVEELDGQLRSAILTSLASHFGGGQIAFLDMAANQIEFSKGLKEVLNPTFEQYGLSLETFNVQSISLPEELQQHLDKAASARMVGDLNRYAKFQMADSIPSAATAPGGIAATGMGLGAGMAMGQAFGQMASGATGTGGASTENEDPIKLLDRLHELVKKGILTQAEFDTKKAEILKKIT